MATAYDSVRYPGSVYVQTDPAALGALAKLFGLPFPPARSCRMLDIGCGDGVNLINVALSSPQGRFVGVDLAETVISAAKQDAAACGLDNIEFFAADLGDLGPAYGEFDYIVAHGVLSWTPRAVGDALIRVVGERLAPGGLAMISFVGLPGGRSNQAIRDLLLFETRDVASPQDKLQRAHAALRAGLNLWSPKDADTAYLIGVARRILASAPGALFHDELNEFYEPRMIADVADAAARHGLVYLGDAQPSGNVDALFPSAAAAHARERAGGDGARLRQYLDFQDMRSFHNAVFVKGGAPDPRRSASRLDGLWLQCELEELQPEPGKPEEAAFLSGGRARLTTNDPALAALFRRLAGAYPEAAPLVGDDLGELTDNVYKLYTSQVARLTTTPPRVRREAGPRPLASALARLQAARGERDFATAMQTVARIEDDRLAALVPLLDGMLPRAELAASWAAAAGFDADKAAAELDRALAVLAKAALLLAAEGTPPS